MSLGYVTHEGPSRAQMDRLEFTVTLYGKGWSDKLADPNDQHIEEPNKAKIAKVKLNSQLRCNLILYLSLQIDYTLPTLRSVE